MDFYYLPGSAPCRSVMLTAKAVGVELNLKQLNLQAGEHLTPEFIKVSEWVAEWLKGGLLLSKYEVTVIVNCFNLNPEHTLIHNHIVLLSKLCMREVI